MPEEALFHANHPSIPRKTVQHARSSLPKAAAPQPSKQQIEKTFSNVNCGLRDIIDQQLNSKHENRIGLQIVRSALARQRPIDMHDKVAQPHPLPRGVLEQPLPIPTGRLDEPRHSRTPDQPPGR